MDRAGKRRDVFPRTGCLGLETTSGDSVIDDDDDDDDDDHDHDDDDDHDHDDDDDQ